MVKLSDAVEALRTATEWLRTELEGIADGDLSVNAGPLRWSCWTTLDHVADCQLGYALQVASGASSDYLAVHGGADNDDFVRFIRGLGVPGVVDALPAFAEVLCATALAAPHDRRAFHPFGESDPVGFVTMGATEMLLHGHDVLSGLGRRADIPAETSAVVLDRLFPHVERHPDGATATLLWATGRGDLPDRPGVEAWRWDGTVR